MCVWIVAQPRAMSSIVPSTLAPSALCAFCLRGRTQTVVSAQPHWIWGAGKQVFCNRKLRNSSRKLSFCLLVPKSPSCQPLSFPTLLALAAEQTIGSNNIHAVRKTLKQILVNRPESDFVCSWKITKMLELLHEPHTIKMFCLCLKDVGKWKPNLHRQTACFRVNWGLIFTLCIEFPPFTVEIRATFSFEVLVLVGIRWVQPAVRSHSEHCASYRRSKTFKSFCGCYITLHTHTHTHTHASTLPASWSKPRKLPPSFFPPFFCSFTGPLAVLVIVSITRFIRNLNSCLFWPMFSFIQINKQTNK